MSGLVDGKVALVVGAGTAKSSGESAMGNGRAAALAYGREGAAVLCADLDPDLAEDTAALIRDRGGVAEAWRVDVGEEASVRDMAAAARERFDGVDILHNNVGVAGVGGLLETAPEDWERAMRINVTGVYLTCRAVVPMLLERGGGAIVNVSSLSAIQAIRPELAYAASKGALNALTINLALEFADRSIRCNAILPGLIDTPMVRHFLSEQMDAAAVETALAARHRVSPTGRMGRPEDVAELAVFLASDRARYINGVLLPLDAGLQYRLPG